MIIEKIQQGWKAFYILAEADQLEVEMAVRANHEGITSIQLSSSSGCANSCPYCEYGLFSNGECTEAALMEQFELGMQIIKDNKWNSDLTSLEFCRMGEPTENTDVVDMLESIASKELVKKGNKVAICTVMPREAKDFFDWVYPLTSYFDIEIKFDMTSTEEEIRKKIISASAMDDVLSFQEIAKIFSFDWRIRPTIRIPVFDGYPVKLEKIKNIITPKLARISVNLMEQNRAISNLKVTFSDKNYNEIINSVGWCGYERAYDKDDYLAPTGTVFSSFLSEEVLKAVARSVVVSHS